MSLPLGSIWDIVRNVAQRYLQSRFHNERRVFLQTVCMHVFTNLFRTQKHTESWKRQENPFRTMRHKQRVNMITRGCRQFYHNNHKQNVNTTYQPCLMKDYTCTKGKVRSWLWPLLRPCDGTHCELQIQKHTGKHVLVCARMCYESHFKIQKCSVNCHLNEPTNFTLYTFFMTTNICYL